MKALKQTLTTKAALLKERCDQLFEVTSPCVSCRARPERSACRLNAFLRDPACALLRAQFLLGEVLDYVLLVDAKSGRCPAPDQVLLDLCHEISDVVSHSVILSMMRCCVKSPVHVGAAVPF